jgi:hypothetical protein
MSPRKVRLAFVVEGRGERHAIRTLAARIAGHDCSHLVVSCANGAGKIYSDLEGELDKVVTACLPLHIIVLADSRDLVRTKKRSCVALREELSQRANNWILKAQQLGSPVESVKIVLVVQQFETWLLADFCVFRENVRLKGSQSSYLGWGRIDDDLPNPLDWLKANLHPRERAKDVNRGKTILSQADLELLQQRSHSFSVFVRAVKAVSPLY